MVLQRTETRKKNGKRLDVYVLQEEVDGQPVSPPRIEDFASIMQRETFQEAIHKIFHPTAGICMFAGLNCAFLEILVPHEINNAPSVIEI